MKDDNIKKILCCTGAVIQQAAQNEIPEELADAYRDSTDALIDSMNLKTGQFTDEAEEMVDPSEDVLVVSGFLMDKMGIFLGEGYKFSKDDQKAIDDFAAAADSVIHA